jgi:hypothetical protein
MPSAHDKSCVISVQVVVVLISLAMDDLQQEQRYVIRYCIRRGLSASETLEEKHEAYGDECLKKTAIFKWHKQFKEGRESVAMTQYQVGQHLPQHLSKFHEHRKSWIKTDELHLDSWLRG